MRILFQFLLLAQYVCSMNLTAQEMYVPNWMKMIGFVLATDMWAAFVTLTVKVRRALNEHFLFCLDTVSSLTMTNSGQFIRFLAPAELLLYFQGFLFGEISLSWCKSRIFL